MNVICMTILILIKYEIKIISLSIFFFFLAMIVIMKVLKMMKSRQIQFIYSFCILYNKVKGKTYAF